MCAVFEYSHSVRPAELDNVGHVNNLEYLRWLQHAAIAHSAARGWPAEAYRQLGQGWVVRSHFIEYLAPAFAGEELVVRTWVADMKRVTSLRRYEVLRTADRRRLAAAETNWALVSLSTLQPCRIPSSVRSAFIVVTDSAETS